MAVRASIVGAAETSVGNVRDHNEDCHFIDPELGIFIVCDGMGGHAAGEVASALAVQTIRETWAGEDTQRSADRWLASGTPGSHKEMLASVVDGVIAAHQAIVAEAEADTSKSGMGTTLIGAMVVGADVVFAHCGDSRAYLVRDGIAMQLTEDQTLLARLLAAGVDVDVHGDGARFKSMLTNAVGIGAECKVATFIVPMADGDRFLLCSDGVHEYIEEAEIGEVLCKMPSPARAAQRLVELALERGGADNATALVMRVLEAGETARPAELLKREELAIHKCPLWSRATPQQRLRALRIALPRDYPTGDKLPARTLGDRVAWIIVEGELDQDGMLRGPGSLLYPEALLGDAPLPDKDGLAICESEVRALALRSDDFRELCEEDSDLGEVLLAALAAEISLREPFYTTGRMASEGGDVDERGTTDPGKRPRSNTDRGFAVAGTRPPPGAPAPGVGVESAPRFRARSPASGLIAAATDVEGDLERAMTDMTADPIKQLEPADDEDAEIVVEASAPAAKPAPAKVSAFDLSEPEIQIEALEAAADEDDESAEPLPAPPTADEEAGEVRELEADEPDGAEQVRELEADEPEADEPDADEPEADEPDADEPEQEVRELEADEPAVVVEELPQGLRDLDADEAAIVVSELEAEQHEHPGEVGDLEAEQDEPGEVRELEADEPPDEEMRELEAEEPATPGPRVIRVHAGEAEDAVDREWDNADEPSSVKAAEAIRALEAEEAAERIIDELAAEEPVRPARPPSEMDIEERHELEVGDIDEDEPNDARVIEILKDTSSQTITMTMPEDETPVAKRPAKAD